MRTQLNTLFLARLRYQYRFTGDASNWWMIYPESISDIPRFNKGLDIQKIGRIVVDADQENRTIAANRFLGAAKQYLLGAFNIRLD